MLRLEDSPCVHEEAQVIVAELRAGRRVALHAPSSPDALVSAVMGALQEPYAIARVPAELDQLPRTVLELAGWTDPAEAAEVDAALRCTDAGAGALARLDAALRGRRVIVEHVGLLGTQSGDEVADALRPSRNSLAQWVLQRADLVTSERPWQLWEAVRHKVGQRDPAVRLRNGAVIDTQDVWTRLDDPMGYTLALQLRAARGDDGEAPRDDDAPDTLRALLWEALPDATMSLLRALAVFGRPLSRAMLLSLPGVDAEAFSRGEALALWRERGGAVVVDASWRSWCARSLPRAERMDSLRALAEIFTRSVRPEEASSGRAGLLCLEAFRLLVELGEVDRAMGYARHGAELLVGHARDLSRERDYVAAARVYERILSQTAMVLPRPLRGYVKHYLHFNRAHARPELEPVLETARGYAEAVEDWPEHAIFWSRTVRAWFLAGESARARASLAQASAAVPAHADKGARLVARTARRLAELGLHVEAMEVLGDYVPDTPRAAEDVARVTALLGAGWFADRLELPGVSPLVLHQKEHFRVEGAPGHWRTIARSLGRSAPQPTALKSALALVKIIAEETRRLLRAWDRDLDDAERARKHTLLSMVDVIASGLDASAAATTWVFGTLERESGRLWLVSGGDAADRYEILPTDAASLVPDDFFWLAEVDAGPSGVARGPVRQLERLPRRDPDALWRAWKLRLDA